MDNKKNNIFSLLSAVLLGGLIMYGMLYFTVLKNDTKTETINKTVSITDEGISEAVEKVYDSVVVVTTYLNNKAYSSGTGFVFKIDGNDAYILTNNHVVAGANLVNITLTKGNVIQTQLVVANTLSDIAVLKVDKEDIISVAEIGSSEDIKVGDTAFAVGAPVNSVYSWTVTRGIISGKDRMVEVTLTEQSGAYVMKVIQTDAAINSGNSGGPLCNGNGEVIGITSLKLVDDSIEGMGFAIPIEIAINYAEKIIAGETITQPYIGISMLNVTDGYSYTQYYSILRQYQITSGVICVQIESGSPAEKAGLKSGDIIVKVNNKITPSVGYLRYYLYENAPGDTINITYIRDGNTYETKVTLTNSNKVY